MAKKQKDFKMDVIELIGHVRGDADGWGIAVMRMGWGDNPTTLDIRNVNLASSVPGKGVSISDEETDRLVDILLERDYGSIEALEESIRRRNSRFEYAELVPYSSEPSERVKTVTRADLDDDLSSKLLMELDPSGAEPIGSINNCELNEDGKLVFEIELR